MEFREEFIKYLHEALNHLSDPKKLLASPMVGLLKLSNRPDKIMALQNILIDAIKSLQPPSDSPSNSKAWRQYESLFYRYIEGFSQQEVAEQLNLGVRHLQREQNSALEILADSLIRQFTINEGPNNQNIINNNSPDFIEAEEAELAWLKEYSINSPLEVQPALASIFETISIIAKDHNVQIKVNIQENLQGLAIHPVAFNQIMLNLLTVGVTLAENGWISVAAILTNDVVGIEIQTTKFTNNSFASLNELTIKIRMAQRLLSICSGKLEVSETFSLFRATLTIPIFDRQILLVIDDNPDTLQLFERYCSNTRYQVIPCQDPSEIMDLVKKQAPDIIIIDVMMPQIDGWLVLSRLRIHPLTASLPIIICTILPQEELAFSLGATGFLRKPVNRQEFLKLLETISLKKKISH
jgi:CheY-like chemotaxis protein